MNKIQECIKYRKEAIQELKEGIDKVIENIIYSGELDEKSLIPAGEGPPLSRALAQLHYQIGEFNNQVYEIAKMVEGKTDTQMDAKQFLVL